MPPPRRTVLASLSGALAGALSGCLSDTGGGFPPNKDTATSDRSRTSGSEPGESTGAETVRNGPAPTPEPSTCPSEPRVPTHEFEPEALAPIPDQPESLDVAAVREYVERYEIAYKWRAVADDYGGIHEFHVDMSTEARTVGNGAVLVADDAALAHGRFGDETPYGHFDSPTYPFAYLVTDEAVWRAEGGHGEDPPDPHSEGTLLECFR